MPLGKSVAANIHEMAHSPKHAKRVRKFGKKKAHQIEVAASAHAADEKKSPRKTKRTGSRKTTRSKRRVSRKNG